MPEERIELIDYLRIIWKWRWVIMLVTLICVIVSGVVSFRLPKIYRATTIIEVGRIFIPGKGLVQREIKEIEDIESMGEVIESDEMLNKLIEKFNLDMTTGLLRRKLKVEPVLGRFVGSGSERRLVRVSLEYQHPQMIVEILNALANSLIDQHTRAYQASIETLDREMENSQEKIKTLNNEIEIANQDIKGINETIDRQIEYQKVIREQIKVAEKGIVELRKVLSRLNVSEISPLEILFLQATLRNQEESIADLYHELNEVEILVSEHRQLIEGVEGTKESIEEKRRMIQDLEDKIVNLQNVRVFSENTKVRTGAIVPNEPVKPKIKLNVLMAAIIGFVVIIMLVFFFEYLQAAKMKEKK